MNLQLSNIINILKNNSLRVTSATKVVAEILIQNDTRYLCCDEIYELINGKKLKSCDQVSVYRILTKFEKLGIVKKSDFRNDASRYILVKSKTKKHEHYFKCINCNTVEPFSECFVHKKEKELEEKGYTNLFHHIEITGLCPSCTLS